MPGGRRTTPLFDLLAKRQPTATPAATAASARPVMEPRISKPVVRVELKPREVVPPVEREREPAPAVRPRTHLSTNAIYLAIAIGGVLLFGAVELGVYLGKKDAKKELDPYVRRDPPTLSEVGAEPSPVMSPSPIRQPEQKPSPVQASSPGDPRELGLNYLYLATLPMADAQKAADYLAENGVQAFAIPVDTKGGSANNAARYRLGVLPGVPSGELKKTVAQNLVNRVTELGEKWQKEHHGSSNFAKYQWEKFQ